MYVCDSLQLVLFQILDGLDNWIGHTTWCQNEIDIAYCSTAQIFLTTFRNYLCHLMHIGFLPPECRICEQYKVDRYVLPETYPPRDLYNIGPAIIGTLQCVPYKHLGGKIILTVHGCIQCMALCNRKVQM